MQQLDPCCSVWSGSVDSPVLVDVLARLPSQTATIEWPPVNVKASLMGLAANVFGLFYGKMCGVGSDIIYFIGHN
jgi:hypothetical protein